MLYPKLNLVFFKLSNLDAKMEELNVAVTGFQIKVIFLEKDLDSVKATQKTLDGNFISMENYTAFVDKQLKGKSMTYKNIYNVGDTCRNLLCLEAYSGQDIGAYPKSSFDNQ